MRTIRRTNTLRNDTVNARSSIRQLLVTTVLVFAMFYLLGASKESFLRQHDMQTSQQSEPDLLGPTTQSRDLLLLPEPIIISRSLTIALGTVTDISTSCWNAPDCTYVEPYEVWDDEDDELLLRDFFPVRYFTITISVDEFLRNELELTSPIHITEFGRSPEDDPSLPYEPGELVYDPSLRADWSIGADVVVMVEEDVLDYGEDDDEISILTAPMSRQYFIDSGGGLTNGVSAYIERSETLEDLLDVIESIYP